MRSIELYLEDILSAIHDIEFYIADIDAFSVFANDDRTRQAVRARLMDIGEASSKLPREFRVQYPEIAWVDVIAFRNILAHEYFGLDWGVIWTAVQLDLPPLRAVVTQMLRDLEEEPPPDV